MNPSPQLVPTSRENCQKIHLTRTSLKKPTTERLLEGSDPSWAGTRFLTSTRRLVGESHVPPNLFPAYSDLGSSLSRTRLAGKQEEVRTGAKTGFQLRRLPVTLERGQGQTHIRVLTGLDRQNSDNCVRSSLSAPAVHVPHRASNSHRKASPPRSTSYETHTVALEEQLEGTRVTRKGDTCSQIAPPPTLGDGCLYQQGRGDEIRLSVCPTVENPVLVHQKTGNN